MPPRPSGTLDPHWSVWATGQRPQHRWELQEPRRPRRQADPRSPRASGEGPGGPDVRPTFQECWTRSCHSIRRAVHTQKLLRDRHTRTSVYVPVSHFNTKLETSLHAIWA